MLPRWVGGLIPLRLPPPPTSASSLPVRFTSWIQKILTNCSGAAFQKPPNDILFRSDPVHASTDRWGEESTPTHTHGVTKLQIITARSTRYRSILPTRRMCVLLRHCYGSTGKFSTPRALRIRAKTETISSQPKTKQTASLDFGRSANSNEFRV